MAKISKDTEKSNTLVHIFGGGDPFLLTTEKMRKSSVRIEVFGDVVIAPYHSKGF
jgi:hypothetical protein